MVGSNLSSEVLRTQALKLFPGGVNSPVRSFSQVGGTPLSWASGKGAWIKDVQGKTYLDMVQSWGAHILGHSPPSVVKAIKIQSRRALSFGAPTQEENILGTLIQKALPSLEKMRFTTSGTEAVMSALRLARGATGRDLILKFDGGYHGHGDSLLVNAGSGVTGLPSSSSSGIPHELTKLTLSVPYNNLAAVQEVFTLYPEKIAAVIVEPVAANMGVVNPVPGFLEGLREITQKTGTLLIFDEVITGFRVGLGGAQEKWNITPDLTTLGKIMGGGLPCGAYGGKRELMDLVAPTGPVYQAGTLAGNPLACAAGAAVVHRLSHPGFYHEMEEKWGDFFQILESITQNLPVKLNRCGGLFTLFFTPEPVTDFISAKTQDGKKFSQFFHTLLENGVFWPCGPFEAAFLGNAHGKKEVKFLMKILEKTLVRVLTSYGEAPPFLPDIENSRR